MGKRVTSRIYLKDSVGLREFLWFSEGDDTSLYFGSSITKLLTKGFSGKKSHVPIDGKAIDYNDGRKMTDSELKEKTSFHKSGIINQPIHQNGKRERSVSVPLIKYENIVPIVSVLPMKIEKYPITRKKIRNQDLIIELNKTNFHPSAIFFL